MKRATYLLSALAACLLLSCKKDDPAGTLTDKDLTGCPVGFSCANRFTENADIKVNETLKPGTYRVFTSYFNTANITRAIYIKAPMAGSIFTLDADAIRNGSVIYQSGCPSCLMLPYKPVDGYVKGVNPTPEKPNDQTKWLIEAKVILAAEGNPNFKDTIFVKQYYSANFVNN